MGPVWLTDVLSKTDLLQVKYQAGKLSQLE